VRSEGIAQDFGTKWKHGENMSLSGPRQYVVY
jgi:hypothetical protein